MKLLLGAVAYLSVVAAAVAAIFAGVSSLDRRSPTEPPVLAKGTDGRAVERAREDEIPADPDRVPVWIVPTAKYHYTPAPPDQGPKRSRIIGGEARGAMAKTHRGTQGQAVRAASSREEPASAPSLAPKHRDNDPFFRD